MPAPTGRTQRGQKGGQAQMRRTVPAGNVVVLRADRAVGDGRTFVQH